MRIPLSNSAFAPPNDFRLSSTFISASETADGSVYVLKRKFGRDVQSLIIVTRYTPEGDYIDEDEGATFVIERRHNDVADPLSTSELMLVKLDN